MYTGSLVALVTPMRSDGTVDVRSLIHLVDWHLANHTEGIVVAGTTGESSTLDDEEHYRVVSEVVQRVAGRIPVIAGTGSNNTRHAIELTRNAAKAGVSASLIVTPYYNKPTQFGLYQHYRTIAERVPLPVILYNVPGRTGCDLLPDTVRQLSEVKGIIGIKEATGLMERIEEIHHLCRDDFAIYSGDDATALEALRRGACGVISVTANIAPQKMYALCKAVREKRIEDAIALQDSLLILHKTLFVESNPIPVKWALHRMGLIPDGIRLPLSPLDPGFHAELTSAMETAGIG